MAKQFNMALENPETILQKSSNTIRWSEKYKAFKVSTSLNPIVTLTLDVDDYLKWICGDYKGIYPDYDDKKHSIDCYSYTKINHDETYIATVYEKEQVNELPYGMFEMAVSGDGETLLKPLVNKFADSTIYIQNHDLPGKVVDFFNTKKSGVRKNKSGMLLFGPPGNGKTSDILRLDRVCQAEKIRVIFFINSDISLRYSNVMKPLLEGERMVFVLEEVTERLTRRSVEELLTFLDGENSWENSITIATTNYPEQMPPNLVDRPGRFETFVKYENPTREDVKKMLELANLSHTSEEDFFKGKNFTFDYISYIISQMLETGNDAATIISSEEKKRARLSETFKGTMGFR